MSKKVVFITRHNPSGIGGGAFASRAYLEVFTKMFGKALVLFVTDHFDERVLDYTPGEVRKIPKRSTWKGIIGLFFDKLHRFTPYVEQWIYDFKNEIDIIICDGSIVGGTYVLVGKTLGIKTITIHHNFELEYHLDNRTVETFFGIFSKWIERRERASYQYSSSNLFLTKYDLSKFIQKYGNRDCNFVTGCFEAGVPTAASNATLNEFSINGVKRKKEKLRTRAVISGSLESLQTHISVVKFINGVFALLADHGIKMNLTITGKNPREELLVLCSKYPEIDVVPNPANIKEIIASHDIYICPVDLGGGLKLRIMDALSIGIPCILHERSTRGYERFLNSEFVKTYSNFDDFISSLQLIQMLTEASKGHVRDTLVKLYESVFLFDQGYRRVNEAMDKSVSS